MSVKVYYTSLFGHFIKQMHIINKQDAIQQLERKYGVVKINKISHI